MPVPVPVAILGFSAFDRRALASYFQRGHADRPTYVHVLNADLADLVIAVDISNEPSSNSADGTIQVLLQTFSMIQSCNDVLITFFLSDEERERARARLE